MLSRRRSTMWNDNFCLASFIMSLLVSSLRLLPSFRNENKSQHTKCRQALKFRCSTYFHLCFGSFHWICFVHSSPSHLRPLPTMFVCWLARGENCNNASVMMMMPWERKKQKHYVPHLIVNFPFDLVVACCFFIPHRSAFYYCSARREGSVVLIISSSCARKVIVSLLHPQPKCLKGQS